MEVRSLACQNILMKEQLFLSFHLIIFKNSALEIIRSHTIKYLKKCNVLFSRTVTAYAEELSSRKKVSQNNYEVTVYQHLTKSRNQIKPKMKNSEEKAKRDMA